MKILTTIRKWSISYLLSRVGWVLAGLHTVWFFAVLHAMGPPSRRAAAFWDSLEGADFTIFAGRFFHFQYQPLVVKALFTADLPALLVGGLASLVLSPLARLVHLGTYEGSYIGAAAFLFTATLQWLAIGRWIQIRWQHWRPSKMPE